MSDSSTSERHLKIDYLELPAADFDATKAFFSAVFGWTFVDYGPDYCSFNDGRSEGGFYKTDLKMQVTAGSALIVFFSENLEASLAKVVTHGGIVTREIFAFPGGRRFHFSDPNGSEFAIWGE